MAADDFLSRNFQFDVDLLDNHSNSDIFSIFSRISKGRSSQDTVFNNKG